VIGFSKALGIVGAAVCADKNFVSVLRQTAAPWMFSTAFPPGLWRITGDILDLLPSLEQERARILLLANRFRAHMTASGISCSGEHHISGVHLPPNADLMEFETAIRRRGFYVKVSRYPSRPINDPCVRITFTPSHQESDVDGVAQAIAEVLLHLGDPKRLI